MKRTYLTFPEDVKYLAWLIPSDLSLVYARMTDAKQVPCNLKNTGDGSVVLSAEGYHSAIFVDKHFEFLLYCGDIVKVS